MSPPPSRDDCETQDKVRIRKEYNGERKASDHQMNSYSQQTTALSPEAVSSPDAQQIVGSPTDIAAASGLKPAMQSIGLNSASRKHLGKRVFAQFELDTAVPRKNAQFVREEIYAVSAVRRPNNARTGEVQAAKATGRSIIGEILREAPRYFRHLTELGITPTPPRHLLGLEPAALPDWYADLVEAAKKITVEISRRGKPYRRRQRNTVPILLAAVASYPTAPDEHDPQYREWRAQVIAWAELHYGSHLVGVYEHLDEAHGHVHCLAANPDGRPVRSLHSGWAAVDNATANGIAKKALGQVYRSAMRKFQEEFFEHVGRNCGLERLSTAPKRRVGYAESRRQKEWEEQVARSEATARERREKEEVRSRERERDFAARIEAVVLRETEAKSVETQIGLAMKKMLLERARIAAAHAQLEEKKRHFEQEAAELTRARMAMEADLAEIGRIQALREDIYAMWNAAIGEGVTSREHAVRAMEARDWPTEPLKSRPGIR